MMSDAEFYIKETEHLIAERGLNKGGKAQQFVDSEVLRLTDPYIPMDTGILKSSGLRHTKIGSGDVIWDTPYARRQYFENKGSGLRGQRWFHRMKADNKDAILNGAKRISGSK